MAGNIGAWRPKTAAGEAYVASQLRKANQKRAADRRAKKSSERAAKPKCTQEEQRKNRISCDRQKRKGVRVVVRYTQQVEGGRWQWHVLAGGMPSLLGGPSCYGDELPASSEMPACDESCEFTFSGSTSYAAMRDLAQQLKTSASHYLFRPGDQLLCLHLPYCRNLECARNLLLTAGLTRFPMVIVPPQWATVRRKPGCNVTKYRNPGHAMASGEPYSHAGCYALLLLEHPRKRQEVVETALGRLRLAGIGVVELRRGVLLIDQIVPQLHIGTAALPLSFSAGGSFFGGPTGTHWTFMVEEVRAFEPEKSPTCSYKLTRAEINKLNELNQRTAAPIDSEEHRA